MINCGLKGIEVYHSSHSKEEMDYYLSKLQQYLGLLKEPKIDIVIGIILIVCGVVVGKANNTQAGTSVFLVFGILFMFMGMFGMSGGLWNF